MKKSMKSGLETAPSSNHSRQSLTKRDLFIPGPQGKPVFQQKSVLVPQGWSDQAAAIAASKYFRGQPVERSILALIDRVLLGLEGAFKRADPPKLPSLLKPKLLIGPLERRHLLERLRQAMLQQRAFFNSPVYFNAGLTEVFNTPGNPWLWYWDNKKKSVVQNQKQASHPQLAACFILEIQDSLESIYELLKTEAFIFRLGSGSGCNFSVLRGKGKALQSGGTSSGLISFLEIFDRSAGAIKSGGITRRAAKMVCIDVDHPEILDFIRWKSREEKKAKDLIQAGWSGGLDGEATRTVAGQNANHSVRLTDKFMKLQMSASEMKGQREKFIFTEIAKSAWECADPGVQFHDTIQRWHTCPEDGEIVASNPCAEFLFLNNTACNLASLNLTKFSANNTESQFDWSSYITTIQDLITAQDTMVDWAGYPTELIAKRSHQFRPLGLGFCGLGTFLMSHAIPYDSKMGRAWAAAFCAVLTGAGYLQSSRLAKTQGAFKGFRKNKKHVLQVLKQHQSALREIPWELLPQGKELKSLVQNLWKEVLSNANRFGVRNSQVTALAPTGTIGLVMDAGTMGIEPEFSLLRRKTLVGGGELVELAPAFEKGLRTIAGNTSVSLEDILNHVRSTGDLSTSPHWKSLQSSWGGVFACAHDISPQGHLAMVAACQKFISGGISKTINMSVESTIGDISKVYQSAWRMGLKAVSIYRNDSKSTQPLEGLRAPLCPECQHQTLRSGACWKCPECGFVSAC